MIFMRIIRMRRALIPVQITFVPTVAFSQSDQQLDLLAVRPPDTKEFKHSVDWRSAHYMQVARQV